MHGHGLVSAPEPGAQTPGRAAEPLPSLRGRVIEIATTLKREADLIEADPYLNPLIRRAHAEAYRTSAARLEIAVQEDRARPAKPLREGIDQALRNLSRLGDAVAPSRRQRVRAALDEATRSIREALDGDL